MLHIYKASAGSGKTYTLVREYLSIALKEPRKFRHVLAITFTNKAANEMKERIISSLQLLKSGSAKSLQLKAELAASVGLTEQEIQERAATVLADILHNYSDFNVSTIDSFVHRVIRSFTYDLNLPMSFEVEMDSDKLLAETVEILMDNLNKADNALTTAVVEYVEQNMADGKSWNIEHNLHALGKELFDEDAIPYVKLLSDIDLEAMKKSRATIAGFVFSFEEKLYKICKSAIQQIAAAGLSEGDFPYGGSGIYGYFEDYSNSTFPNEPRGNTRVVAAIENDKWYTAKAATSIKNSIDGIKENLKRHYRSIASEFDASGSDYFLAKMILKNYYAFMLLADMQRIMNQYKKENNIVHISEFQRRVHEIVSEQDAPVIYERIGEWFDSIMIDEQQDTSILQWRNLLPLIENSQFKNEDSLVVGDGKQAIYRFRNGKVEQFVALPAVYGSETNMRLKEREVAINNYGVDLNVLEYNYRSRKAVVEFNNDFYETLRNVPELKNKSIYTDQSQLQGRKVDGGYVSIDFLKDDDDDATLDDRRRESVLQIITDAQKHGYGYRDVAVLTHNNIHASSIASFLISVGINVVSSESLLINNAQTVKLVVSVLKYLDNSANEISRSEIVYFIHVLLLKKPFKFEQFDYKTSVHDFDLQLSKLIGKEFVSANYTSLGLVELVRKISSVFSLNEDDASLQFFTDEVMAYTIHNRSNIREFLEWWNEVKHKKSVIYPDSLDAVRVMTIHKSKGLQFPIVIMADADWQVKVRKRFWLNVDKPWMNGLPLAIVSASKEILKTDFAELYHEEEASTFLDVLNLVYVATTRAEDKLYILSTELKNPPAANNSVTALLYSYLNGKGLWQGFKTYELGDAETLKVKTQKNQAKEYLTQVAHHSLRTVSLRKNQRLLWRKELRQKIDWGNLLHNTLKQVRYVGDEIKVLRQLQLRGEIDNGTSLKLQKAILEIINHQQLRDYFSESVTVLNERMLIADNEIKIPDRVVVDGTIAILIDYKTGGKNPDHIVQISEYADTIKKFGFETVRKLLVYTEEMQVVELE
jgi:ATP-dependent exoDNAse (exonuclease V) beta subunit